MSFKLYLTELIEIHLLKCISICVQFLNWITEFNYLKIFQFIERHMYVGSCPHSPEDTLQF